MKQKMDFVTNSSSTSWLIISGALPALTASLGWVAANVQTAATSQEMSDTERGDIKDSAEAADWLKNHPPSNDPNAMHFMNSAGQLTDLFWEWYDQSISSANTSSLMGIVGEFDADARNESIDIAHLAIIVREEQITVTPDNISQNTSDTNTDAVQTDTDSSAPSAENVQLIGEEVTDEHQPAPQAEQTPPPKELIKTDAAEHREDVPVQASDGSKQDQQETPAETANSEQPGQIDPLRLENKINQTIKDRVKHPELLQPIRHTVSIQAFDSGQQYVVQVHDGQINIAEGPATNETIKLRTSQEILNGILSGQYQTTEELIELIKPYKTTENSILPSFKDEKEMVKITIPDKENFNKDLNAVLEAFDIKMDAKNKKLLEVALMLIG